MKTLYSLRKEQASRFSGVTDTLMVLLLVIGLFQIALCAGSAVQMATPVQKSASYGRFLELQTNSVQVHGVGAALHEKS